jgi:hypothetical protein
VSPVRASVVGWIGGTVVALLLHQFAFGGEVGDVAAVALGGGCAIVGMVVAGLVLVR